MLHTGEQGKTREFRTRGKGWGTKCPQQQGAAEETKFTGYDPE